ncbi:MAG: hypothetical protein JNG88_11065 [Phycisphaerales bacterium]|nr:hypothetical protein [Phycisphaerales bacterium]
MSLITNALTCVFSQAAYSTNTETYYATLLALASGTISFAFAGVFLYIAQSSWKLTIVPLMIPLAICMVDSALRIYFIVIRC